LLWRGIWTYVRLHRIDAMFGCASLEGAEPARHAAALSSVWRNATAKAEWRAAAIAGRGVDMTPLPAEAFDERAALRALPPLLKGYWRLGAKFGTEAVIDPKFGTTDVFVIMPVSDIEKRYIRYFTPEPEPAPLAA